MVKITIKKKTLKKILLLLIGIFLALLFIEISLRVAGFWIYSKQRAGYDINTEGNEYRILALGESTTADLQNGQGSWPEELEITLNKGSEKIKFKVYNEGISSITTSVILSKLKDNLEKYNPHMVIVMMGINDKDVAVRYCYALNCRIIQFFKDMRIYKLGKILWGAWKNKLSALLFAEETETGILDFKDETNLSDSITITTKDELVRGRKTTEAEWNTTLLGADYVRVGEYAKALELFEKIIEVNPSSDVASAYLGKLYFMKREYTKGEEMSKKALVINPDNFIAISDLGTYYGQLTDKGVYKPEKALPFLKRHIQIKPESSVEYKYLVLSLLDVNKQEEAEAFLDKRINQSATLGGYTILALNYLHTKNNDKLEDMFKKIYQTNPNYLFDLYTQIGTFYENSDSNKSRVVAKVMFNKAKNIRNIHFNPITQENYRKLYATLHEMGIKLVAMQYPTMDVYGLKIMLDWDENIIFVSNEENFKKALQSVAYEYIFIDRFGANFGHCTKRCNRLITENVANILLNEMNEFN